MQSRAAVYTDPITLLHIIVDSQMVWDQIQISECDYVVERTRLCQIEYTSVICQLRNFLANGAKNVCRRKIIEAKKSKITPIVSQFTKPNSTMIMVA